MELVEYNDVPARCDDLLDEVAKAGTIFQVMKDGKPMLRIVRWRKRVQAIRQADEVSRDSSLRCRGIGGTGK